MKRFPLAVVLCFVFYLSLEGISPGEIWADSSEPLCQTVSSTLQPPYIGKGWYK
jgi:hypothetical protein